MNVAPETGKYYGVYWLLHMLGLPIDIIYFTFLNLAKEGDVELFANVTAI